MAVGPRFADQGGGMNGDLVQARRRGPMPVARAVWREGMRVM